MNSEHLAVFKRGANALDEWRRDNPGERPDLRGADLHGSQLAGWNLARVDFDNADLSGADLRQTNMYRAILRDAKLDGTEFKGANTYKVVWPEGFGIVAGPARAGGPSES